MPDIVSERYIVMFRVNQSLLQVCCACGNQNTILTRWSDK